MNEPLRPQGVHTSRRAFVVAGGVAVVGGAVGGVLVGRSTKSTAHDPLEARVSAELADAASAERRLIAGVDVELRTAKGARRTALRQVRAGHVAHLATINGAIDQAIYPATRSASPSAGESSGASSAPVQPAAGPVATAERRASAAAAARALRLTGSQSALLATIAAAEATHAELLAGPS